MLVCCEGHKTEVYIRTVNADGDVLYLGKANVEQITELLELMEAGVCPACAGVGRYSG